VSRFFFFRPFVIVSVIVSPDTFSTSLDQFPPHPHSMHIFDRAMAAAM